ncbi:ion channel [Vibrio fluvialis]|jgi:hypothetical protein|uniref:ion channel n=1 Tax=Vibrio fluvialis TaxID=676 RepID=UPI001C9BD92D|nr:potassium channel family protein [Vibrio fluvialis]
MSFLRKLFIGNRPLKYKYVAPAVQNQVKTLKKVWNDDKDPTFGIERIFRLFLVIISFIFPILYIRHFSGKYGLMCRKIAIELHVIFKLFLPILLFKFHLTSNSFVIFIAIYLMLETITYLLGLIFLSDIYVSPISNKRSFLLLLINYIEITLYFSVLYHGLSLIKGADTAIQHIYYSFVTSTTLGYGEMLPIDNVGYVAVISQLLTMVLFVSLFFNNLASNLSYKNNSFKGNDKKNAHNRQ